MSTDAHLSLADGQEHDVSEWEKAAAAVLRKARRLSDDDPDETVWERLTRTTIDGIGISPLGTPALVADPTSLSGSSAHVRLANSTWPCLSRECWKAGSWVSRWCFGHSRIRLMRSVRPPCSHQTMWWTFSRYRRWHPGN